MADTVRTITNAAIHAAITAADVHDVSARNEPADGRHPATLVLRTTSEDDADALRDALRDAGTIDGLDSRSRGDYWGGFVTIDGARVDSLADLYG